MNTCLYSIFSSIYSSLCKRQDRITINSIAEKMKTSSTLIPIKEKHFNMFLESLLLYSDDKEKSCNKLFEAYNEADNCSLCVSCVGCAKSFYRQVVTLLFNSVELRGSFNYWNSVLDHPLTSKEINFNSLETYLLRHIEEKTTALE